ncbi:MAG: redoxin domain-containing protein [Leadbetterella sp.]
MNKIVASLIFSLLTITTVFGQTEKPAYKIDVKIKGTTDGQKLYLAHYYGNTQFIKVDSAEIKNEQLTFAGKTDLKGGVYLVVIDPSKFFDVIISGEEKEMSIETDTASLGRNVKFKGSKENLLTVSYREYLAKKSQQAKEINDKFSGSKATDEDKKLGGQKMDELRKEVDAYIEGFLKENGNTFAGKVVRVNQEPTIKPEDLPLLPSGKRDSSNILNIYKSKYFQNLDFSDERFLRSPFIQTKIEKYFKELVYQIPDSIIVDADRVLKQAKKNKDVYRYVLYLIANKYETTDIVGLDPVWIHLAENYYLKDADWMDSAQTAKFKARVNILKPIQTGKVMPNFILQDFQGKDHTFFESKSKYTIIYFYSPDCGHCKDNAPKLAKYYEESKDKGVTIFHVPTDHDEKKIKEFVTTHKLEALNNIWDAKMRYDFKSKYDVYSTPTSYILDKDKKIIARRISIEEIPKFLEYYDKKLEDEAKRAKIK